MTDSLPAPITVRGRSMVPNKIWPAPMKIIPTDAPWLAPAAALVAAVAALAFAELNRNAVVTGFLHEGSAVETASAALHFLAVILALVFLPRARGLFGLIAVCAFVMGARELDWHHAFTTHGLFSTKEYFRDSVPTSEKVLAGVVALSLLALLGASLFGSLRNIRRLVASRAAAVVGLATILVIVPLLMLADAAPRLEREAGLSPSADLVARLLAVEELGELALPLIVMLVILQVARAFAGGQRTWRMLDPRDRQPDMAESPAE